MGDKVRSVMEAMAWDLRALENKGYFDDPEIKDILAIREDHEYAMNKMTNTPVDFLKAIQYEMELVDNLVLNIGRKKKREVQGS